MTLVVIATSMAGECAPSLSCKNCEFHLQHRCPSFEPGNGTNLQLGAAPSSRISGAPLAFEIYASSEEKNSASTFRNRTKRYDEPLWLVTVFLFLALH